MDTAYIGMLGSDIALTAVGVTVPLLLIMVSIENIFAAGAAVLAGRQLGAEDHEAASRTVTTVIGLSVVTGAVLNVVLDPIFMFDWGLGMGVGGASLATTVSQFVTFFILAWFYVSGRPVIKLRRSAFRPSWQLVRTVTVIGTPTAVIQICLSVASSLTNMAAAPLPDADQIIAAKSMGAAPPTPAES